MAKEDATAEEVNRAVLKLMDAIQSLDMKAGDKTDLEMALQLTETIDLTQYVEKGQEEYLAGKGNGRCCYGRRRRNAAGSG